MSNNKWMIMYVLEDGEYLPKYSGSNIVPMTNVEKVIHVPEEIAKQSHKFNFDGKKLTRKKDEYVLTLEQLREKEKQEEIALHGGMVPPHFQEKQDDAIEIQF